MYNSGNPTGKRSEWTFRYLPQQHCKMFNNKSSRVTGGVEQSGGVFGNCIIWKMSPDLLQGGY